MAIQLTVQQSGGKLRVYASNFDGQVTAIVDQIVVSIETAGWSWYGSFYEDDFAFGPRVHTGWGGLMVEMSYAGGPAGVHATAKYWNVDRAVKSPAVSVS